MKSIDVKAVLVKDRVLDNEGHVQIYEVGKYNVIVHGPHKSTGNHLWVEVRKRNDIPNTQYLPALSERCFDDEGCARQVEMSIGTTSYGSLPMDEITKFMDAMDEGLVTARYVCDKFLCPMVDGKWDWTV